MHIITIILLEGIGMKDEDANLLLAKLKNLHDLEMKLNNPIKFYLVINIFSIVKIIFFGYYSSFFYLKFFLLI